MNGIGIMSGSSLDGIDIALVSFDDNVPTSWQLVAYRTYSVPEEIAQALRSITKLHAHEIAAIESQYSKFIADCILSFSLVHQQAPDFISIHGHTVLHLPEQQTSWQLLNGGYIAAICNKTVICDFRSSDMALGGQGTPMAVLADKDLFQGFDYYINLGGIANISYKDGNNWLAFDLFPFNQVLNHFANQKNKKFDEDGGLAIQGKINDAVLSFLLEHDYISKQHPKSLDNKELKELWIDPLNLFNIKPEDVLRTYNEFTVIVFRTILAQGSSVFLSGGGAKNKYFISMLKGKASEKNIEINIPNPEIVDYKEAILIAYAGYKRLKGEPNFIASATGATNNAIGGAVYLPPLK